MIRVLYFVCELLICARIMVILKQFIGDLIGAEHICTIHHFRAIFDENEQTDEMSKPLGNNPSVISAWTETYNATHYYWNECQHVFILVSRYFDWLEIFSISLCVCILWHIHFKDAAQHVEEFPISKCVLFRFEVLLIR